MGHCIYCSRYWVWIILVLGLFCGKINFRFFFALLPFFLFLNLKKLKKLKLNFKIILIYALFIRIFFSWLEIFFQQISLLYTDVANSAVFTVLYVVIVPVIAYFFFSKKIHGLFGLQF